MDIFVGHSNVILDLGSLVGMDHLFDLLRIKLVV